MRRSRQGHDIGNERLQAHRMRDGADTAIGAHLKVRTLPITPRRPGGSTAEISDPRKGDVWPVFDLQ
jgi:hypothetical protein